MPSGKIHTALTISTASGILAPHFIWMMGGEPWNYIMGCLTGIMVMPDLDVDNGNISDTFIRKIFRPAQWLWRLFWTPYALAIPHRHYISHFPILGTILRIGYVFFILNLILFLLKLIWSLVDSVSFIWIWNWSFFFGLAHADFIHWAVDNTIRGKETFEDA